MRKIQKIGGMLLTSCMMLSLMACGSKANAASSEPTSTSRVITAGAAKENKELERKESERNVSETTASETAEADKTETSETGKVLVAYYSASGNTARAAQNIASVTGGDLFEITPVEPYTSEDLNWTDKNSRVNHEHDDESLRNVTLVNTNVEKWTEYDTVFVGYPIWWGIAAWPVNNFVKNNDFTGKTVIPFATSSSSGIGQSGKLLEEMAGSGDWKEGHRFGSSADASEISSWVSSLGLAD